MAKNGPQNATTKRVTGFRATLSPRSLQWNDVLDLNRVLTRQSSSTNKKAITDVCVRARERAPPSFHQHEWHLTSLDTFGVTEDHIVQIAMLGWCKMPMKTEWRQENQLINSIELHLTCTIALPVRQKRVWKSILMGMRLIQLGFVITKKCCRKL